jgi:hypothetical protein
MKVFIVVSFFAGLVLGSICSLYYQKSRIISESKNCEERLSDSENKLTDLKTKMDQLASVDMKEYQELKDEKEKYKKADEILGKVFLLFLADLGLKSGSPKANIADRAIDKNKIETSPSPSLVPVTPQALDILSKEKIGEASIDYDSSPQKLIKFLEKHRLDKPKEIFKLTDYATTLNSAGKKIMGHYEGVLYRSDKTTEDIVLEINFTFSKGKLEGTYSAQMIKNGNPGSTSTGNGDNQSIKNVPGKDNEIIIEMGGRESFAHLVYFSSGDYFLGDFYNNKNEIVGLIKLRK